MATPARRPSGPTAEKGRVGHLASIDVVRVLTVGGVILVHSTSLANAQTSVAANAVLSLCHITRSVFLALSAFVLTYSFDRKPLAPSRFWRRRYPLVVAPYVVWSAIYVLTGGDLGNPVSVTGRFLLDLLDGGAHFHLYFLLLTFQLYLVFPYLMAALRRWPGALWPALGAGAAFQFAFDAAIHYGWRPPVLSVWLTHPSSWLPSYALFVVAGVAAARHLEDVTAWVRGHQTLVAAYAATAVALTLASYVADLDLLGYSPVKASEVFQPTDVLMAVAFASATFAAGLRFTEGAADRRLARLRRGSDVSFGVFLAHPLILAGVLDVAQWAGVSSALAAWPSGVVELLIFAGLVPFVYGVSFVGIDLARRTPLSLALSGRRQRPRRVELEVQT